MRVRKRGVLCYQYLVTVLEREKGRQRRDMCLFERTRIRASDYSVSVQLKSYQHPEKERRKKKGNFRPSNLFIEGISWLIGSGNNRVPGRRPLKIKEKKRGEGPPSTYREEKGEHYRGGVPSVPRAKGRGSGLVMHRNDKGLGRGGKGKRSSVNISHGERGNRML